MEPVSVVLPTYNRAASLPLTLRSALRQTHPPLEVLVIDDDSKDGTEQVVKDLAREATPTGVQVRYFRQPERTGANAARNRGIQLARGSAVAFLDSDDVWHPRKLQVQLEMVAGESSPWLVYCGRYRVDGAFRVLARQYWGRPADTARALRTVNVIGPLSATMMSTGILRDVGGFDVALPACQDWDLFLRTAPSCRVLGVSTPLLIYMDQGSERVSRNPKRRLHAHVMMYRKHGLARCSPNELSTFHGNVAEDLEQLGHLAWAQRFLSLSRWENGNFLGGLSAAFGKPQIRKTRYARYRRRWKRERGPEDERLFAEYTTLGIRPR